MATLRFIVGEKKQDWNFEIRVKIDPINTQAGYTEAQHREQQRFDFPSNIKFTEVDWGDGVIESGKTQHYYDTTGEFTIRAKVTSMDEKLTLTYNNIVELIKIPGFLVTEAVGPKLTYFDLESNKFPQGALLSIMQKVMEQNPDPVNKLDSFYKKKNLFKASNQLGYLSKTVRTGKNPGLSSNTKLNVPEATILSTARTQEELDLANQLSSMGWKVEMASDGIYRIELPHSVKDVLVDGSLGNDLRGLRVVMAKPFYDADNNLLGGRIMKLMPHNAGNYPRDERNAPNDGDKDYRMTLVPQDIKLAWEYQLPDSTTWTPLAVIKPLPVPAEGDTLTKIPAGKFTGKYKIAEPITLDRNILVSGTKIRARLFTYWDTQIAPDPQGRNDAWGGHIKNQLRIVDGNGLTDNLPLIEVLP